MNHFINTSAANVRQRTSLDNGLRSPRTPTYIPTSSSFTDVTPFDFSQLFDLSPVSPSRPPQPFQQKTKVSPQPAKPLGWIWQCHLCHSRWPLGVTRRCLLDGHYYCSGEVDKPNLKKKKKGQSCSSEFDYVGWQEWGDWKRKALKYMENPRVPKRCENCEFPSQCRYNKSADGVLTLSKPSKSTVVDTYTMVSTTGEERKRKESSETSNNSIRYYSVDSNCVSFEALLAKTPAESSSGSSTKQSKMTDFYNVENEASRISTAGDKIEKFSSKKSGKKSSSTLSTIQEEFSPGDIGIGLHELVMPILDYWSSKKEKKKTAP